MDSDTEDASSACLVCWKFRPKQGKVPMCLCRNWQILFSHLEKAVYLLEIIRNYWRPLLSFPSDDLTKQNITVKKVTWISDQVPEVSGCEFKDLAGECTFCCTVAIPWSHRMEDCCHLEPLNLQKGPVEAWIVQTKTDASKHSFESICDNQIQNDMNALQANELEMVRSKTPECQLMFWSVSSFILLVFFFPPAHTSPWCITCYIENLSFLCY